MSARLMLLWCWREVLSVCLVGTAGMVLFKIAWLPISNHPPHSFLLLAGVAMCSWLHPRVLRLSPAYA